MSEQNLLPCPFCGSEAKIFDCDWSQISDSNEVTYSPGCTNYDCIAYGNIANYDTPEEAAKAWNKRVGENNERTKKN